MYYFFPSPFLHDASYVCQYVPMLIPLRFLFLNSVHLRVRTRVLPCLLSSLDPSFCLGPHGYDMTQTVQTVLPPPLYSRITIAFLHTTRALFGCRFFQITREGVSRQQECSHGVATTCTAMNYILRCISPRRIYMR